jgi:hypothetical protein
MIELLAAMSLLLFVAIPLGWSLVSERRMAHSLYQRAIAIQAVDGEMETLLAGEWQAYGAGRHTYTFGGAAARNLPQGELWLTIQDKRIRLEWQPAAKHHGGAVIREGQIP